MRILIFNWKDLSHPKAGGAEVYTEQLARHWATAGDEVTLFCAAVEGQPTEEVVDGVRIVRRGGRFGVYGAARKFYLTEGRGHFDVVLDGVNTRPFHSPRFVHDVPVVALIHQLCREIWWHEMPLPVAFLGRFWLERRWLKDYRDVLTLTVSESSRESLAAYGLRNLRVVPEGIEVRQRPGVAKELLPTLIFVGRLSSNKRPLSAIRAFRVIQRQIPDAQLWIVGAGPQEDKVRKRAGDGVTVWGRVDEPTKDELMARAHILVVTSVREGWGLVVDEAASMGTPAVGYDAPGLRDSITAAGGVLTRADTGSLARVLVDRLTTPVIEAPLGYGAVPWDVVSQAVRSALTEALGRGSDLRST